MSLWNGFGVDVGVSWCGGMGGVDVWVVFRALAYGMDMGLGVEMLVWVWGWFWVCRDGLGVWM